MNSRTDAGASHVTQNPRSENNRTSVPLMKTHARGRGLFPSALSHIGTMLAGELALCGFLLACAGVWTLCPGCEQKTSSVQPTQQRQVSDTAQDQQGTNGRIAEQGIGRLGGREIHRAGASLSAV